MTPDQIKALDEIELKHALPLEYHGEPDLAISQGQTAFVRTGGGNLVRFVHCGSPIPCVLLSVEGKGEGFNEFYFHHIPASEGWYQHFNFTDIIKHFSTKQLSIKLLGGDLIQSAPLISKIVSEYNAFMKTNAASEWTLTFRAQKLMQNNTLDNESKRKITRSYLYQKIRYALEHFNIESDNRQQNIERLTKCYLSETILNSMSTDDNVLFRNYGTFLANCQSNPYYFEYDNLKSYAEQIAYSFQQANSQDLNFQKFLDTVLCDPKLIENLIAYLDQSGAISRYSTTTGELLFDCNSGDFYSEFLTPAHSEKYHLSMAMLFEMLDSGAMSGSPLMVFNSNEHQDCFNYQLSGEFIHKLASFQGRVNTLKSAKTDPDWETVVKGVLKDFFPNLGDRGNSGVNVSAELYGVGLIQIIDLFRQYPNLLDKYSVQHRPTDDVTEKTESTNPLPIKEVKKKKTNSFEGFQKGFLFPDTTNNQEVKKKKKHGFAGFRSGFLVSDPTNNQTDVSRTQHKPPG